MCKILLWISLIATLGLKADSGNVQAKAISLCSGKTGVLVPMPGSCSGFFFCLDGNAIASSCGNYYQFNRRLNICDHPQNVKCNSNGNNITRDLEITKVSSDSEATFVCTRSAPEGYIFAKNNSCNQFYVCRQNLAVRRICPPQKYFNATSKKCQISVSIECNYTINRLTSPSTIEPSRINDIKKSELIVNFSPSSVCLSVKENTAVAHPWDCMKYVYCQKERPIVISCPEYLHFNRNTQKCEWPNVAKCEIELKLI